MTKNILTLFNSLFASRSRKKVEQPASSKKVEQQVPSYKFLKLSEGVTYRIFFVDDTKASNVTIIENLRDSNRFYMAQDHTLLRKRVIDVQSVYKIRVPACDPGYQEQRKR